MACTKKRDEKRTWTEVLPMSEHERRGLDRAWRTTGEREQLPRGVMRPLSFSALEDPRPFHATLTFRRVTLEMQRQDTTPCAPCEPMHEPSAGRCSGAIKRVERNGDPRHGSCVRTCRAAGHRPLTLVVRQEEMMKKAILIVAGVILTAVAADAVMIGFFPGLDQLIEKADAIVILRVDKHVTGFGSPTLYSTHDCYVYQTLKGDIPTNQIIRLQLMDTRSSFVTSYAILSTHLMFLTKKRTPDEPTDYRTIEFRGANTRLTPFGHEKMPDGETIRDQVADVLRRTVEYNKKQHEEEQAFLNQMIKGTAEPTD
jgi:hypothetical protein